MFASGGFNMMSGMNGLTGMTGATGATGVTGGGLDLNSIMKQMETMFSKQMESMKQLMQKLLGNLKNGNAASGMFPPMDLSSQMTGLMQLGKSSLIGASMNLVGSPPALSQGAGASTVSAASLGGGTAWGKSLANDAKNHAVTGPGGWCYKYVAQALARHGVNVSGASAYMAADQLAGKKEFREVKVSQADLKKLPAGAIVVWNKGNGHEHGHISIALGDGREVSDLIRNQTTNYGTSYRVFLPNK